MYRDLYSMLLTFIFSANAIAGQPLKEADLKKKASHIVVGEVKGVYVSNRQWSAPKDPSLGYDEQKRYIVELEVVSVEKGEGISAKSVIYARLMQARSGVEAEGRPDGPLEGHTAIPRDREKGRYYLSPASNQFYGVIGPNGYKPIPKEPPIKVDVEAASTTPPIAEAPPL